MTQTQFSKAELSALAQLMDLAVTTFSNDGGQDMKLSDTPENRTFADAVMNHDVEPGEECEVAVRGGKIILSPESLAAYFEHRAQALQSALATTSPSAAASLPVGGDATIALLELVNIIKPQMDGRAADAIEVWTYADSKYDEAVVNRAETVLTADYGLEWRLVKAFRNNSKWVFFFTRK